MNKDVDAIFNHLKNSPTKYNEDVHCRMILKCMINKGRLSNFCTEALIDDSTFYRWIEANPLFARCYALGKLYAREIWENEGYELRDQVSPPGTINHAFDHWRMVGWSRFGVGKNPRIKLNLKPGDDPAKHYAQLLKQASEGDFTASEFKQFMEAINVGLNVHSTFELQQQINELKSDLETMSKNTDAHNSGTNKGIAQKD